VHINDPDAYKHIYTENAIRKANRYDFATKGYGLPGLLGLTVDHRIHSARRKALNPFFSKAQVLRLEPIIHANLHVLLRKLRSLRDTGKVVSLNAAFSSLAMDVVSRYCFGREYGMLLEPDFAPQKQVRAYFTHVALLIFGYSDAVNMRVSRLVHVFNHFPWLMR
jgi:cytochrome P450